MGYGDGSEFWSGFGTTNSLWDWIRNWNLVSHQCSGSAWICMDLALLDTDSYPHCQHWSGSGPEAMKLATLSLIYIDSYPYLFKHVFYQHKYVLELTYLEYFSPIFVRQKILNLKKITNVLYFLCCGKARIRIRFATNCWTPIQIWIRTENHADPKHWKDCTGKKGSCFPVPCLDVTYQTPVVGKSRPNT